MGGIHMGRYLVNATATGVLKLWDVNTGRCVQMTKGHTDEVRCMAPFGTFNAAALALNATGGISSLSSPSVPTSGTSIASAAASATDGLQSARSSVVPLSAHIVPSSSVAANSCTKFVTCSLDGLVKLWSVDTREEPYIAGGGARGGAGGGGGEGEDDGPLVAANIRCVCTMDGHLHRVVALEVQQTRIISACWDKTVKIWDFPVDII